MNLFGLYLIFIIVIILFVVLYFLLKTDGDNGNKNKNLNIEVLEDASDIKDEYKANNEILYTSTRQVILDNGFTESDLDILTEPKQPCIFFPYKRTFIETLDSDNNTVKTYLDDVTSINDDTVSVNPDDQSVKIEYTCPSGMELNSETECCRWEELKLSTFDKIEMVAPTIVESLIVSYIFEKMITVLRKLFPPSQVAKRIGILKSKIGKLSRTLGNFSRKATFEAAEGVSRKGGRVIGRVGGKRFLTGSRYLGRSLIKGVKQGSKVATRSTLNAAKGLKNTLTASTAPCIPCTAAVIAFEVISAALDIADIQGYQTYKANEDVIISRNIAETKMEANMLEKDGVSWPMLFPILTAFPDLDDPSPCPDDNPNCRDPSPSDSPSDSSSDPSSNYLSDDYKIPEVNDGYSAILLEAFIGSALEKMAMEDPDGFIQILLSAFSTDDGNDEMEVSEETNTMFAEILQAEIDYNHIKRDKIIYDLCVSRGYGDQVEFIESMSSETVIGVTLNEEGARRYNERMQEDHIKYSNPSSDFKKEDIPEDYVALVAAYTDTYRIADRLNAGKSTNPNVIEKKLDRKMTLMMPWAAVMYNCLGDKRSTGASYFTKNPADYGSTFDYEKGYCNYTKKYCDEMGLDYKNSDCYLSEGQRVAEVIFGETITRSFKKTWDKRIDDFNSGDPLRVTGGIAGTLFDVVTLGFGTSIVRDITSLINASKGRGVGVIPVSCQDDEEQKGQLCYPKCRDGYRSSALECEGTCPPGSKNTGLTCIDGTSSRFHPAWKHRRHCYNKYDGKGILSRAASTCVSPCLPGFKRRSYALGSAFCDKPRSRYTRAFKARLKSKCPDSHPDKQNGLCYKECPDSHPRGRGPICMKKKDV